MKSDIKCRHCKELEDKVIYAGAKSEGKNAISHNNGATECKNENCPLVKIRKEQNY